MTTAEKITVSVAIAGAFGLGTVVSLVLGHLLGRRERKVNIADKQVQMAEALMARMHTELARAQEALEKVQQEHEDQREALARAAVEKREYSQREAELHQKLQEAHMAAAKSAIEKVQEDVTKFKISDTALPVAAAVAALLLLTK